MEELSGELERLCEAQGIQRFSPEEMVELLEEGETVDWIVEQVLPEGSGEANLELKAVLDKIAEQVAPPPAESETEEEATDESRSEAMDLSLQELKDLGLPPGVDMEQVEKLMASPQGALLADFGQFCEEREIGPEAGQDEMNEAIQSLHEEWLDTPREALEGKKPGEVLAGGRLFPQKVETFRREAPKIGRNDPCPCGSGKKYKRCCGKAG